MPERSEQVGWCRGQSEREGGEAHGTSCTHQIEEAVGRTGDVAVCEACCAVLHTPVKDVLAEGLSVKAVHWMATRLSVKAVHWMAARLSVKAYSLRG
jgi:hypothetical protein